MRTCPRCGNKYRPDVDVCPNDGVKLGPLAAGPPAGAGPPARGSKKAAPPPAKPTGAPDEASKRKPDVRPSYVPDEPASLRERSTATSWIVAVVACLLLFVGFFYARERILLADAGGGEDGVSDESGDDAETTRKKKKKRRRKGKRRRAARTDGDEEDYADYDWEQDFVVDDSPLGDVLSEPDPQDEYVEVEVKEPEPYEPTREEYQPDGPYRPTAGYSEPGANSNVVEIDLSKSSSSSPLDEVTVKRTLNERRVAPCYDRWVQKIPQMKGRVRLSVVVAPDGHVASVKVKSSELRSRVVERCIVNRVRRLKFPRAEGGQRTKFDTHFDFTNR